MYTIYVSSEYSAIVGVINNKGIKFFHSKILDVWDYLHDLILANLILIKFVVGYNTNNDETFVNNGFNYFCCLFVNVTIVFYCSCFLLS